MAQVRILKQVRKCALVAVVVGAMSVVAAPVSTASAHEQNAGWRGAHSRARADCGFDSLGRYINVSTPDVYAYNYHSNSLDTQQVAFRAHFQLLVPLVGWTDIGATNWLYGAARDNLPVAYWENASGRQQNWFHFTESSVYPRINQGDSVRVWGEIYWYKSSSVPNPGRDFAIANHFGNGSGPYLQCQF